MAIVCLAAPLGLATGVASASGPTASDGVYRSSSDGRYQEHVSPYPHVLDTATGARYEPVWAGFAVDPIPGCAVTQTLSVAGSLATLQTCVAPHHRPVVRSYPLEGRARTKQFAARAVQPRLSRDGSKLVWPATTSTPRRVFDLVNWRFVALR
jgi:hypothetical protein